MAQKLQDRGDKLEVVAIPAGVLDALKQRNTQAQLAYERFLQDISLVASSLRPGLTAESYSLDDGTITFRTADIQPVADA